MSIVKANVKQGNNAAARKTLGLILHTLQDFYSHSDWVELGNNSPYDALIKADQQLGNLAGPDTPTCKSCDGDNCDDNILPDVLTKGMLTSGYLDVFSSDKPAGKCSHGGPFDKTSKKDPVGGINKDGITPGHGSLHKKAANLAVDATVELLEDIRVAVGDKNFTRLMGLTQSSALCFVIDTTGSMRDDIADAKSVSFEIIDSTIGTPQEPSEYILVPFNDPGFGPAIRTTDPVKFKEEISALTANGGGDGPELSMSGLRLGLTTAPPASTMYVFTDASAKDSHLESTVTALIESSKSEVNFLLTNIFSRRRRSNDQRSLAGARLSSADLQLYQDLAQVSGGQAIQVSKSSLSVATAVIKDSSVGAVVTVFHVVVNPGQPKNFTFTLDSSISNIFVYITGVSSLTFRLTSPTGETQTSSVSSGPLASFTAVGNLLRISLNTKNKTGLWEIGVDSNSPYSVKVTGQSSLNFIFNFVEESKGAHSGISVKEGRPTTGSNVTLLVTVTGSDTVTVTEVALYDSFVPRVVIGSIQSLNNNDFLVRFTEVPGGQYVVRLRGADSSSSATSTESFERQASTQITTSRLSVTAQDSVINIEPGSIASIPFTVSSDMPGTFTVEARNDRSFATTSPSSLTIAAGDGGKVNGTVTLTVPSDTASGTDVTLTIEAQNADRTDTNYIVIRLSVTGKVTDLSGPVCQVVSISGICNHSLPCTSSQWEYIANLTDGINGTGIATISLRQGNGILKTSMVVGAGGESVTVITYNASCCSESVEVAAVDRVGNVGIYVTVVDIELHVLMTPRPVELGPKTVQSPLHPEVAHPH
ncbi:von Willebrand factor A domain-containing protein 7-like [Pholidichthys leucotaenia]